MTPADTATPDAATSVTAYLLAGPLGFGAIGYGVDRWLGTRGFVLVGLLTGVALAIYIVWLRYGVGDGSQTHDHDRADGTTPSDHTSGTASPGTADSSTYEEKT